MIKVTKYQNIWILSRVSVSISRVFRLAGKSEIVPFLSAYLNSCTTP